MLTSPTLPLLPITEHLPAIAQGIREHSISILQAPPGTGKTTILPLFLAQQEWLIGRSIIVLQPRRLAAKAVAMRMSELLGEEVGTTVGYQIRLERRKSATTRIEIITEGLLARRIIADPELRDVGLIIFDEFHERSVHADVGVALAQEVASVLRRDLKLLIMSATLDSLRDVGNFKDAWRYSFNIAPFPVDIRHISRDPRKPIWEDTAKVVRAALQQHAGDILAFLPGAFEIERCAEILLAEARGFRVLPLYGELPYEQQQAALSTPSDSVRRVVLATNIAETSLTIEGVRIVVDAGLQKVSRSTDTGITTLKTERITRDAADQRAGRAGRTAPGVCLRLWSEQEHMALRANREPEILRIDPTQHVLELAAWGVRDPAQFDWITAPQTRALESAQRLLKQLDAISQDGTITETGKILVRLGTHPRIGASCIAARKHNLDAFAAAIIPLLEERNTRKQGTQSVDCTHLMNALATGEPRPSVNPRVQQLHDLWLRRISELPVARLPATDAVSPINACGFLLAMAFPERIARRRADSRERYLMASGVGATLPLNDPLSSSEYIVIAEMHERTEDSKILRAVPLDPALFHRHLKHLVIQVEESVFDQKRGVMISQIHTKIGAISIGQGRVAALPTETLQAALMQHLRTSEGFSALPFSATALSLQQRCAWIQRTYPTLEMPDISADALRESEPFWLLGQLPESGSLEHITASTIEHAIDALIPWQARKDIDQIAPQTLTLPNGKIKQIDYSEESGPVIEAMIQELFGLSDTPRIGRFGAIVTCKLLSPARRPMQVTRDLASFWKNGYALVRKELRGRYPKHKWPEDPTKANSDSLKIKGPRPS